MSIPYNGKGNRNTNDLMERLHRGLEKTGTTYLIRGEAGNLKAENFFSMLEFIVSEIPQDRSRIFLENFFSGLPYCNNIVDATLANTHKYRGLIVRTIVEANHHTGNSNVGEEVSKVAIEYARRPNELERAMYLLSFVSSNTRNADVIRDVCDVFIKYRYEPDDVIGAFMNAVEDAIIYQSKKGDVIRKVCEKAINHISERYPTKREILESVGNKIRERNNAA